MLLERVKNKKYYSLTEFGKKSALSFLKIDVEPQICTSGIFGDINNRNAKSNCIKFDKPKYPRLILKNMRENRSWEKGKFQPDFGFFGQFGAYDQNGKFR